MNKTSKKYLKVSGLVCLGAAVASISSYITTRYLSRVALDREEPDSFKKAGKAISRTKANQAFLEELQQAAQCLAKEENETVQITAQDGVPLVGHWIPCRNAKRIIIAISDYRKS